MARRCCCTTPVCEQSDHAPVPVELLRLHEWFELGEQQIQSMSDPAGYDSTGNCSPLPRTGGSVYNSAINAGNYGSNCTISVQADCMDFFPGGGIGHSLEPGYAAIIALQP